jgi:DNA polymerase-3 subunit delta
MVITLTGSNSFALRRRLNELVAQFVAEQGDLGLERFDGDEAKVQDIIDSVQSLPFLASKKMVVVRDPGANKEIMEQIEQIISAAGETTEMIFYEPAPDKRTAYYKTLQKKTKLEEFKELDSRGLAGWLAEEAKNRGGELNFSDANYLVERIGPNQSMLANELDKLLLYDNKITRESIELLTEPTPQSKIFDLLDAAFSGNKKRALDLYEDQRAQKVEPQAILAMLAWQLEVLVLAHLGKGKSAEAIAKDSGMRPYPITKAANLLKKIDDVKLKQLVNEAYEMDIKSKTTALNLDEALKTYITTL